jgi:hypothetical protein
MTPEEQLKAETDAIRAWVPIVVLAILTALFLSLSNGVQTDRVCGFYTPPAMTE